MSDGLTTIPFGPNSNAPGWSIKVVPGGSQEDSLTGIP
jgi:hypothetical protein